MVKLLEALAALDKCPSRYKEDNCEYDEEEIGHNDSAIRSSGYEDGRKEVVKKGSILS